MTVWRYWNLIITLRASCSAVYCNQSCLFVCGWICYQDSSKLHASILTNWICRYGKGSDHLQLIKFWPSCAARKGSEAGLKFLVWPYYSQHAVFASLWALFQCCYNYCWVIVARACKKQLQAKFGIWIDTYE